MFHILVLVLALCMDTFVASMAYGANKVHITWEKIVVMNAICSGCLGIALVAGSVPVSYTHLTLPTIRLV